MPLPRIIMSVHQSPPFSSVSMIKEDGYSRPSHCLIKCIQYCYNRDRNFLAHILQPNCNMVPTKTKELLHMLVWQSRPSCSNCVPCFGKTALWCYATCRNAKIIPGGLCHNRVSQRLLDPINERGDFVRGIKTFTEEITHFTFYLLYSNLRH